MNTVESYFSVKDIQALQTLFPKSKSIHEVVRALICRLFHFKTTGKWIGETELLSFAKTAKLSDAFSGFPIQKKIKRVESGYFVPPLSAIESMTKQMQFVYQFIQNPTEVGAILPSSKHLAKEIVSELKKDTSTTARVILEVGPGTGSFTEKIIKAMRPEDTLHLVEFDKTFAEELTKKYGNIPGVTIFHTSILEFTSDKKYDYIISGLPLNGFEASFVEKVFSVFTSLANEKATLSYFEYLILPDVKKLLAPAEEKENISKILEIKSNFYAKHPLRCHDVIRNIPAARVRHHKL